MRLNNKVLLALGIVWLLFLGMFYLTAHQFLMRSFLKLENSEITKDIQRVHQALDQISYTLGTFTIDWAHWNDAYDFIGGKPSSFVSDNLDITAFSNSNINLLIYLDKKGKILVGTAANNQAFIAYPKGLDKYIYPGSMLEKHNNLYSNTRGMIALPSGIMLIAAAGTSYTDLSKPINGTLITGRFFTSDLLKNISSATQLNLSLYLLSQIEYDLNFKNIFNQAIQNKDGNQIILVNNEWANAYTLLRDIYGQPIGMIQLKVPRSIYLSGKETIDYYIAVFVISGFLLGVLIWFLLRILVLKRLEYLNNRIIKISKNQDIEPIDNASNDELLSLSMRFNNMMQTIQNSYEKMKQNLTKLSKSEKNLENINKKLINEINERKQAEEKISVLHNQLVLSARRAGMTDITKGVLRAIKNILNNANNSIILIKGKIEASELEQKQFAKDVKWLEADIASPSIQWQKDIQIILKEMLKLENDIVQMKNIINIQKLLHTEDGTLEKVSLPRLISDSILLNKTNIDKFKIEVFYKYEFTDKLIIDRVKALHILVSLIRNSIDALSECNNEPKKIMISIEKQNKQNIMIKIADNGVGISPDNLNKVFAFGFTTKSKKKGHGYALHISEALVHEMGGSLTVTSSGFNQGAVFTLILPINAIEEEKLKKIHITREKN